MAASMMRFAAAVAFAVLSGSPVQAEELALAPRAVVNQSGAVVESNGMRWLGTGANSALSRLGMIFALPSLPPTSFKSATLVLTSAWTQWIPVDVRIAAELSGNPADFGPRALPSDRPLTIPIARFTENTKWGAHGTYEIDVTEPVRALLARFSRPVAIALIAAGEGSPWGRKYFTTAGEAPTLKLAFDDPPAPPPRLVVSHPVASAPAPAPAGSGAGATL